MLNATRIEGVPTSTERLAMVKVVDLQTWSCQKAPSELARARVARDLLDSRAQLAHAENACRLFERADEADERSVAGLLKATGLEVDARTAVDDYEGALERAQQTITHVHSVGGLKLADEIALRHLRRCEQVAGAPDRAMREALAAYIRIDREPVLVPSLELREREQLATLTTVLSSAHRLGGEESHVFGRRALVLAQRSIEGHPSLLESVRCKSPWASARFLMWAGLFCSGSLNERPPARAMLGSYLDWTRANPTKRNQLLRRFARGELLVSAGDDTAARRVFEAALDDTAAVLPRKHRVARSILAGRGVI